jgi:thioredoxin reductase (NADPH)
MKKSNHNDSHGHGMSEDQYRDQIGAMFEKLPNKIQILLFTGKDTDDVFSRTAKKVILAFKGLSPKIEFKEYDLEHEMAEKLDVTSSPTIVFNPDEYAIKWLGAPMGEEGKSFLELLMFIGLGKSHLEDQSLQVAKKIDSPRSVKVFVSATCPYCPQQAVNVIKAAIENPEFISIEIIDIQCRPDLAQKYSAHSVPQTYANDILIGMGAQPEELFMLSLQNLKEETVFIPDIDAEHVETDVLIVGGGPAGLTAGIYAVRSGLKAAVIERGALGGQVATTPVVENYPGFTQVGGKTLVDIMVSHALQYVQIFQGEEVLEITPGPPFQVTTSRRRFASKAILLATGATHTHLGAKGESRLSGRGVSYCSTCDGPLFKEQSVIMVGGGNSAVTEALHLHNIGVSVTVVHRRDALRAQEHLVKNLFDSGIPVIWDTEVKEIRGEDRVEAVVLYNTKSKDTSTMQTDGVFIAIGYAPEVGLAKKLGIELTEDGFIKQDERHRTNIPGIYTAGDVEGGYKQIVTAAGQGSEAALVIFEDMINPYWTQKRESSPS